MWDFLRDLGETNVGGAAVIKSIRDDNTNFDLQSISQTRILNVAKAYGWWISKDSVSLLLLKVRSMLLLTETRKLTFFCKPVDFTILKACAREFLKELMIQIFINSQRSTPLVQDTNTFSFSRNRSAIEVIFVKASRIQALAMGLVYFLSEAFQGDDTCEDDGYSKFIQWAVKTAKATLQTGIDVVTSV